MLPPPGSGIARHRHSLIGGTGSTGGAFTTPRRNQVPKSPALMQPASNPFKRPSASGLRPETSFPSLHEGLTQSSEGARVISGASLGGLSTDGSEYSGTDSVIITRQTNDTANSSSAAIAQAVAMAVSQVQADAQNQIHELKLQLEESRNQLKERDNQLQEQTTLLRDLESTFVEFQNLKEAEEAERDAQEPLNAQNPEYIEDLKLNHARELEERDRKLGSLKTQLEERRSEFRETLDDLQTDMQDSSAAYVREIQALQTKLGDAETLQTRVQELERLVQDLETGGGSVNQVKNQDNKAQIMKLAELENVLLQKDQNLADMKEQLDQAREQVKSMSLASVASSPLSSPFSKRMSNGNILDESVNEKLKQQLKSERAQRIQFENEISNLESIIEAKIFREEELEREIEALRNEKLDYTKHHLASESSTPKARTPLKTKQAFSAENTPKAVATTEGLLEALPIKSPESITVSGTAISNNDVTISTPTSAKVDLKENDGYHPATAAGKTPSPGFTELATPDESLPIYKSPKKIDLANGREKWCGLCEREGHESIECPFEEDF